MASRWYSYSLYGTVMGVLALSYLFGDAISRYIMSLLLGAGMGWRGIFMTGAALLGALLLANLILLRETAQERGLPAPAANPLNLYGDHAEHEPEKHERARKQEQVPHTDNRAAQRRPDAIGAHHFERLDAHRVNARLEPAHHGIVFGVGDFRRVEHVVEVLVVT